MKQRQHRGTTLYPLGIFALFLAGFLLLVLFGADIYEDTVNGQVRNNRNRALLSFISTAVRNGDTAGSIAVQDGPEGDALVLIEQGDDMEYYTKLYCLEGRLLEEYSDQRWEYDPASAEVIGETELFQIDTAGENLLRVTTDAGSTLLHIRCGGGAGQ